VAGARDGAHAAAIERALRAGGAGDEQPVVARVRDGRVVLDVRTIRDDEIAATARGLARALGAAHNHGAGNGAARAADNRGGEYRDDDGEAEN
jgi:hypothetical protein